MAFNVIMYSSWLESLCKIGEMCMISMICVFISDVRKSILCFTGLKKVSQLTYLISDL